MTYIKVKTNRKEEEVPQFSLKMMVLLLLCAGLIAVNFMMYSGAANVQVHDITQNVVNEDLRTEMAIQP